MGCDPFASGMGFNRNNGKNLIIFQPSVSFSKIRVHYFGVHLSVPTKSVIGSYLPSSQTLLLTTQILVCHTNIITWDAFLQSLLSCLFWQSFTSKSALRHQPKRSFNPVNHMGLVSNAVSRITFFFGQAPAISKMTSLGSNVCPCFQEHINYKSCRNKIVRTRYVRIPKTTFSN